MEDSKWMLKNTLTVRTAAKKIGVKTEVIQHLVDEGKIEYQDGRIQKSVCERLVEQRCNYIGLKEFIMTHDSEQFAAKYSVNRNKYIDFLEINDYFGIQRVMPDEIMFALPETEDFYFLSEDVEYLNFKSLEFFENFGLTDKEKVNRIIRNSTGHPFAVNYIAKYITYLDENNNLFTPAFTMFVNTVLSAEDINNIEDEDLLNIIDDAELKRTKEYLVEFYNWVADYQKVKYHRVSLKRKESKEIKAYSYEEYVALARIIFNKEYDNEHSLTIKALENHTYAEMWLFLALHYVCGWRASDICKNWIYLDLESNKNPFNINPSHIKEDILDDSIETKTYCDITLYSVKKLEMSFNLPSKTHDDRAGKLRSMITPDLREFFGRLILIAEYHHYTSKNGYMRAEKTSVYQNWTMLTDFFGREIYELLNRHNISSRKLNKSYLQGIEKSAREDGNTSLVSHIVASYARNHMDINTTAVYLKDHGLSGETADVVLYLMMQRGVMGAYLYQTLICAFPEQFSKLSIREQTQVMEYIPISAYELETTGIGHVSSERIYSEFMCGETEAPTAILKAMYAIGQGKGKGKDPGIYCKKKALGFCCTYPEYNSCLANICPYHVFTSEGIPALIRVIKEYNSKEDTTGRNKYKVALKQKIIPAFQEIINEVMKDMSQQEKIGLKRLIMEGMNE